MFPYIFLEIIPQSVTVQITLFTQLRDTYTIIVVHILETFDISSPPVCHSHIDFGKPDFSLQLTLSVLDTNLNFKCICNNIIYAFKLILIGIYYGNQAIIKDLPRRLCRYLIINNFVCDSHTSRDK